MASLEHESTHMESKDDQAQQPDFKGKPLPVPHPDTLTKAVSLPPSATKDWDIPAFLRLPTAHGRIAGFEPTFVPEEWEMPAHLRSQKPADQPPQPGEPDFEPLPLPVPHTMRVEPLRPLFDPKDLEIPAHLRGQEPADPHPQLGEPGFGPLPLPVPHMMRMHRSKPSSDTNEVEMPAFLRNLAKDTE